MSEAPIEAPPQVAKSRVLAIIDGFNLYHAIDKFEHGINEADKARYKRYKWLCLRTLIERRINADEEDLVSVHYFTSYPYWDENKKLRHQTYVNALHARGVQYTLGEFKAKTLECRVQGGCRQTFSQPEEKQTDVNIATKIIELAANYDTLILVTADSDQVPSIRLLLAMHPQKRVLIMPPIGRNSKELVRAAGKNSRMVMTEEDLRESQMPNPVDIVRNGKATCQLWRPADWAVE